MHVTALALIIIQGIMEHTTVVPHCQAARAPLEARNELLLGQVLGQEPKDRQALCARPALYIYSMRLAAIDAFVTRFVVGANQWMLHL